MTARRKPLSPRDQRAHDVLTPAQFKRFRTWEASDQRRARLQARAIRAGRMTESEAHSSRLGVGRSRARAALRRLGVVAGLAPDIHERTALRRWLKAAGRTQNPRKARTMAKRMKRNRLGRFVKSARRRIGRAISGETVRRRRKKKSRASKARRRRNPTQGATMSRALVANPRKRRRRARRATTTTRRRRRRPVAARNPRRRRRHHHHRGRHRRNPGMGGGFIKAAMGSLLPMGLGGLGGAVCGLADAKFMSDKPVMSALSKVALGALGAAVLRKRPALANGWAGGVMGSFGYSMGVKAAGGLVAHSPTTALKGIADMAQENPEMAALLEGLTDDNGVGALTDDNGVGDAEDYAGALAGSDDGDGVGDIIEAD